MLPINALMYKVFFIYTTASWRIAALLHCAQSSRIMRGAKRQLGLTHCASRHGYFSLLVLGCGVRVPSFPTATAQESSTLWICHEICRAREPTQIITLENLKTYGDTDKFCYLQINLGCKNYYHIIIFHNDNNLSCISIVLLPIFPTLCNLSQEYKYIFVYILLFSSSRNNFSWAWARAHLFHENEDTCLVIISPLKEEIRAFSRVETPDYSFLLLSFSPRPGLRSFSLVRSEESIQRGFACIFIVSSLRVARRRRHRRRRWHWRRRYPYKVRNEKEERRREEER